MGIGITTNHDDTKEKIFAFDYLITSLEQKAILVPMDFTIEQAIAYAEQNADKMYVPTCLDPEITVGKPMFGENYECSFVDTVLQERLDDLQVK